MFSQIEAEEVNVCERWSITSSLIKTSTFSCRSAIGWARSGRVFDFSTIGLQGY